MEDPRGWIAGDENAGDMLARVPRVRPSLLLPPLHRVPLRSGNVVEITGSSPSAKSEVLLQAAINCILPKEWNGVHFGGLERMVMFFDLDCRFDVLHLSQVLKLRIIGSNQVAQWTSQEDTEQYNANEAKANLLDDELFLVCMRRFLYIRCYNSLEFLDALKTMHSRAQVEIEALGVGIHFLMIDSIGAFYWMDRACLSLPLGGNKRNLSLQNVVETVVSEFRKLLHMQPVLVLATKATIFGAKTSTHDAQRAFGKRYAGDKSHTTDKRASNSEKPLYHEYMPAVWQAFVTHRIHFQQVSEGMVADKKYGNSLVYTSEWIQPRLNILDRFTVRDDGILLIS